MIQGYENSTLHLANVVDAFIGFAGELLLHYGHNIVTGGFEQCLAQSSKVLVQLEFHSAAAVGIGKIRSRATSAAYAKQARISSASSCG